jgi:hypothetical protein
MVRRVAKVSKRCGLSQFAAAIGLAAIACAAPALAAAGPAAIALPPVLVPEGATPFLRTHAVGTQNYVCVATGAGLAWRFAGPQATLFVRVAGFQQQLTTHFLSPNPDEAGIARATWQGSFDSSRPRADRRRFAVAGHLDPTHQHVRRRRSVDRLQSTHRRGRDRARPIQHRLCLPSLTSAGVRTRTPPSPARR